MHKSECKSCKTAKEIINHYDNMIMENQVPSLEDMRDYNTAMQFYENMIAEKGWHGYNVNVKGAIYPHDLMGKSLTEEQAKEWVTNMHHKTMSGEVIKGEKWDIATTTNVLEQAGMKFDDTCSPIEGYLAMNMAWHDHYKSAYKSNMENNAEFYVSLAMDCLVDDDAKHSAKERMYIKHYLLTHA